MAWVRSHRSRRPCSITPSACPRNSTCSTPTSAAEASSSASRSGPASWGDIEPMPASPLVTRQYVIVLPCLVQRATAAAVPYSMSSGWATMTSARSHVSGSGWNGGGWAGSVIGSSSWSGAAESAAGGGGELDHRLGADAVELANELGVAVGQAVALLGEAVDLGR